MPGDPYEPRDRHRHSSKPFRPDPERYKLGIKAARAAGTTLSQYLRDSLDYLIGLRDDPPPRPDPGGDWRDGT